MPTSLHEKKTSVGSNLNIFCVDVHRSFTPCPVRIRPPEPDTPSTLHVDVIYGWSLKGTLLYRPNTNIPINYHRCKKKLTPRIKNVKNAFFMKKIKKTLNKKRC